MAAAALLELRHGWETNNHRFPSPWPPKIKALGMNSLGANNNSVSAHRIFPIESKIRWSHGYELAGLATNGGPWTLYEENNIYLPRIRRLYWRREVMTVTNAPKTNRNGF